MTDVVRINEQHIDVLKYKGQRVVTFAMVDEVHKRPDGTARRNFNENKTYFDEGDDFHRLDFEDVSNWTNFVQLGLAPSPNGLTVLTESGYLLICKSLTDPLSWRVQKQLVRDYFRIKDELISHEVVAALQSQVQQLAAKIETLTELRSWFTIREFIEKNGLVRQLPPRDRHLYGKHVSSYSRQHGLRIGRRAGVNTYNIAALEATLQNWLIQVRQPALRPIPVRVDENEMTLL